MPNALSDRMDAARIAEGRRRMTHWAPPALIPRPSLADVGEFAAEALTPYGNYVSARDAVEDFQGGNPVSGSVNALLALPGLGIVGAVGRGAKRAGKTVNALSEGVNFALSADQKRRKLTMVELPVSAIEASIKKNKTFHVGPGGTGAGIEGRLPDPRREGQGRNNAGCPHPTRGQGRHDEL